MTSPSVAVGERELLPCPFCGSAPELYVNQYGDGGVECTNQECGAWMPEERWNRRAALEASHAPQIPTDAMIAAGARKYASHTGWTTGPTNEEIVVIIFRAMCDAAERGLDVHGRHPIDAAAGTTPEPK